MPTLYVRDCSDELHQRLLMLAQHKRRSLNAQVISLLETAVETAEQQQKAFTLLDRMGRRRSTMTASRTDAVDMLREDRAR